MGMLKWIGWAGAGLLGWAATLPFQGISGPNVAEAIHTFTIFNGITDGIGPTVKWEHFGWHDDEAGSYSALDLSRLGVGGTDGLAVYLNADGTAVIVAIVDHQVVTGSPGNRFPQPPTAWRKRRCE